MIGMSISVNASAGDDFSIAVHTLGQDGVFNSHRVLRLNIGADGSIYLTMMKINGSDKSWTVASAPFNEESLTRNNVIGKFNIIGQAVTPKFSFHASGIINIGKHRAYRPPLRTLANLEQLCLIQFGEPVNLPVINIEELNSWQKINKHPLLGLGMPFPCGVIATIIFVSGPNSFDALKDTVCSDFELTQENLIFHIRGLTDEFPEYEPGNYGYDLMLSTGQWCGGSWDGPSIAIPTVYPSDDPESSRKKA